MKHKIEWNGSLSFYSFLLVGSINKWMTYNSLKMKKKKNILSWLWFGSWFETLVGTWDKLCVRSFRSWVKLWFWEWFMSWVGSRVTSWAGSWFRLWISSWVGSWFGSSVGSSFKTWVRLCVRSWFGFMDLVMGRGMGQDMGGVMNQIMVRFKGWFVDQVVSRVIG